MTDTRQKTRLAKELHDESIRVEMGRNILFWKDAELWYKLKRENTYKYAFGDSDNDNVRSWRRYVRERDVPLSTVEFKILLFRRWVLEFGFSIGELKDVHTRKLQYGLKFIKNKNDAVDILEIAKHPDHEDYYSFDGFKKHVSELYTGRSID